MLPWGSWNDEIRICHCPERRLRIARRVEQQRAVGAVHREEIEPGVIVGYAPGGDRGDAVTVESLEELPVECRLLRQHGGRRARAVVGEAGRNGWLAVAGARVLVDGHVEL